MVISDAYTKMKVEYLEAEDVLISVSGGSDSDIVVDMSARIADAVPGLRDKMKYIFINTGIEFEANRNQIKYLSDKYGIEISEIRPEKPVPVAIKESGYPVFNKMASEYIYRLQKHHFRFEDKPYEQLIEEYKNCQSALDWWCNRKLSKKNCISNNKWLKEFLIENPPDFPISPKCCEYSKKKPAMQYAKDNLSKKALYMVTAERRAEGGARSNGNSCISGSKASNITKYRPIFWFSNNDKSIYEDHYNIVHSNCYRCYGQKRSGCVGCSCNPNYKKELEVADIYEPKLANAARNIFSKAYDYTDAYKMYAQKRG